MKNISNMMMYVFLIVSLISCGGVTTNPAMPSGNKELYYKLDTLGYIELKGITNDYLQKMKAQKAFPKDDDYVNIVVISNTIAVYRLEKEDVVFKTFQNLFDFNWLDKCVSRLEAEESWGLGFYSKKYDLIIGGMPFAKETSYLKIKGREVPE